MEDLKIIKILPDLKIAPINYSMRKRLLWSIIVMIIYIFLASFPVLTSLNGFTHYNNLPDPLGFLRAINASNPETFTELGLSNFVLAWIIVAIYRKRQNKLITKFDDKTDYDNLNQLYKTLTLIITFLLIPLDLSTGVFGLNYLSIQDALLIMIQLLITNIVLIYLDEFIRKGWGIFSGVGLFIIGITLSELMWYLFTFIPVPDGIPDGGISNLYLGIIPAYFQILIQHGLVTANSVMFFRVAHPLASIFAFIVFIITAFFIYMYLIQKTNNKLSNELIFSTMNEEFNNTKIFKANLTLLTHIIDPIYVVMTLYSVIYIIFISLNNEFPNNSIIELLGIFQTISNNVIPTGGLVYYLIPPRGIIGVGAIIQTNVVGSVLNSTIDSLPRIIVYSIITLGLVYLLVKYLYSYLILDLSADRSKIDEYMRITITFTLIAIVAEISGALIPGVNIIILVILLFIYNKQYLFEVNQLSDIKNIQKRPFILYLALIAIMFYFISIFSNVLVMNFIP